MMIIAVAAAMTIIAREINSLVRVMAGSKLWLIADNLATELLGVEQEVGVVDETNLEPDDDEE